MEAICMTLRSLRPLFLAGLISALVSLVTGGPGAVLAQPAMTTEIERAELSARLYFAGRDMGDAVMVLAAARLRLSIEPTPADRTARTEGAEAPPAPEPFLAAEEMLATARRLAAGDEALLGLIEDAAAERTKGVASGPLYNIGSLAAGGRDRYDALPFRGGEYAEVYVEARSRSDLRLTVTDAAGRLVCSDSDRSHIAYCGWRPDAPGRFTIVVENRGAGTSYALMTN